ncbi:MAG: hypothetical protein ACI7YS_10160 [Flavobacterium sp.]
MKLYKILFLLFISSTAFAQVYTDKIVGKKNQELKDSIKQAEYPYLLPIWGDKVTKKGFRLPYSAGISINAFQQESDLIINNLNVGFNNGPQYNLDQIVRFDDAVSRASSITIRPDVWILPFLNVYGIFGKAKTSTEIKAAVWLPDENNNWSEIMNFSTKANFDATSAGFGLTPTIGIGGGWLALDMNMLWTDISELNKPVFTYVFGPRIGKTFKLKKPDSNIAFWTGAFRVKLSSETNGNLALSEVLELDGAQEKVDAGIAAVSEKKTAVDSWWNGLNNAEQANPANKARYNTATKALDAAGNLLNSIDGALSSAESSTVQYSLDKKPADMWNFLLGTQYQLNRHYMFRGEVGFLGSRTQYLVGLQYRFGL